MEFRLVGVYKGVNNKLGAWRDVGWWGFALGEGAVGEARPSTGARAPFGGASRWVGRGVGEWVAPSPKRRVSAGARAA